MNFINTKSYVSFHDKIPLAYIMKKYFKYNHIQRYYGEIRPHQVGTKFYRL